MKNTYFILVVLGILFFMENYQTTFSKTRTKDDTKIAQRADNSKKIQNANYEYPGFYKGIYLNIASAKNFQKLSKFVKKAKEAHMNTLVLDVQSSRYKKCVIPKKNVQYCIDNGIHPIARVVIFPDGLKYFPVSKEYINRKLDIAESACISGFKEIQLDYIRFNDSSRLKYLTKEKRYQFIEGFINKVRKRTAKYDVKIAADIFGRIPLNKNDIIGQKMESLDKVVDVICPMAYPSHYTWSKKLQKDPYHTVYITSKKARERTVNADIVTYIQAFKIKLWGMPYDKYISEQIKAVEDSNIRGFIFWNARQRYHVPFEVTKKHFTDKVTRKEKRRNDSSDES